MAYLFQNKREWLHSLLKLAFVVINKTTFSKDDD
ncbi:hypothetical protein DES36_12634 [Alkalibaculum bacchi]|uniref:Uncharacterized protein n=1 Tax=Alkalibaculum bacchi TaxID=645887 RepID=A0A366HZ78_9FIRM|nr:hypothetical protein DES36_12634 [Alkalibaculum bacchi]